MKKALISLFVGILILGAIVPAFAEGSIEGVGYLEFLDEQQHSISSIQVNRVAVEDLNHAVQYLDDTALVVWKEWWQPTFYVNEIPEDAVYLKWTNGYRGGQWVIVRGVQTELPSKLYVPARDEAGLYKDDYRCDDSLLCKAARNGW